MKNGTPLLNANRFVKETGFRLNTPFSDVLQPTDVVEEGDIAVITGLKHTFSSDTLIDM